MARENRCPKCGIELPANAPEGLCPQCLMKAGMADDSDVIASEPLALEGPGTKIGNYELLELIGEGGMGLVYLAEQQEPKRKVALKIVKLGMDTRQVVARFETERQTLAVLAHPNIAHVFDAGTTETGRPYFVMEHVQGRSITKYCDEHTLSVEQRLEFFQQVCEGVHHAHQKGIIHRDIKPSNILVSIHGDRAVPKIIDFGIAKAITQPLLTEKTSYTEHGQLLGTPEYMSPEQAEMASQDVDTRSDIYSLGVLLYELLAGATPFDAKRLRKGGIDRIQQVICQEEPRTPSARLTSLGDKGEVIAEKRRTQIITLTRRLHRELEWIPMKAMRKDRSRRYRSASELSDDIQNYLTGTPLIAGPESNVYRARKFVHTHAGFVASAALVALVIILGLITSTAFSFSAEKARGEEAAARVEAEQARDKEAALRVQVEQALARAEQAEKVANEQRKLAEERAEEHRRALYMNRIALAEIAYRDGNIRGVRKQLDACPEDLRAWEWDHLNYISEQSSRTLRGGPMWNSGISPDGKRVLVGGDNYAVKVLDTSSGVELMTLPGHTSRVINAHFSPDGKRIVSGAMDGTLRVWNTDNTKELMTLKGHKGPGAGYFSPDGTRIISHSMDKTIKVWDAKTGHEIMTWDTHTLGAFCHAISPDGRTIVSGGLDKGVGYVLKLWDAKTGAELRVFHGHQSYSGSVGFSPDGKLIVSGSADNTIKVWDAGTGEDLKTLRGHKDRVNGVAIDSRGRRIVSASRDGAVKVWDIQSGSELMTLLGHTSAVTSVVFSPDGERVFSSSDQTVKIWELGANHSAALTLEGLHKGVAFSPDGKHIVTGGKNITLWDAATGKQVTSFNYSVRGPSFSPDGKRLIATDDNDIKILDASSGRELMTLSGHEAPIWSRSYSPDGTRIVSGGRDKTVKIWNAITGTEIMTLRGHGDWPEDPEYSPVSSVAFSPDGKRIVSGSYDCTVKIWNAETGAEVMTLQHPHFVTRVRFSPDGKRILSAGDRALRVWDAKTGSQLLSLQGNEGEVTNVVFSPDGKRIVSTENFVDTIKIWDAETGLEISTLKIGGLIRGLSFSPDGKTLATTSHIDAKPGQTVTLWKSAGVANTTEVGEDTEKQEKESSSVPTVPVMGRNSTDDTTVSGLDKLQGTWVGNELGREGEVKWTFSGNSFDFKGANPQEWIKGSWILSEERVPKQADFTVKECSVAWFEGKTAKGIYELKNESLILAASAPGDETRPSNFEPSGEARVFQLKRQPSNHKK